VLIEPTQYQPGQAQPIPDEKRVGTSKQIKYSGALKRGRKAQLTERCTMLIGAVRQARERANADFHAGRSRQLSASSSGDET
jgi:hypothetical protein